MTIQRIFVEKMKEKEEQVIELHGLTAHTMKILLNCIYSEEFIFTIENVQEILPAAALLQLTDIRSGCELFLKNQLEPSNCLGIKKFAEMHNCPTIKNSTQEYIFEHFSGEVTRDLLIFLPPTPLYVGIRSL